MLHKENERNGDWLVPLSVRRSYGDPSVLHLPCVQCVLLRVPRRFASYWNALVEESSSLQLSTNILWSLLTDQRVRHFADILDVDGSTTESEETEEPPDSLDLFGDMSLGLTYSPVRVHAGVAVAQVDVRAKL